MGGAIFGLLRALGGERGLFHTAICVFASFALHIDISRFSVGGAIFGLLRALGRERWLFRTPRWVFASSALHIDISGSTVGGAVFGLLRALGGEHGIFDRAPRMQARRHGIGRLSHIQMYAAAIRVKKRMHMARGTHGSARSRIRRATSGLD